MNKTRKAWLAAAAVLLAAGCLIFFVGWAACGFDFTKFNPQKCETNTYELSDPFDSLRLEVTTAKVQFAAAEGETCKVVCVEPENLQHSVFVEDGVLTILSNDTREWYEHIGFFSETAQITVYLPQGRAYRSLFLKTDTGGAALPAHWAFEQIEITSGTADVDCRASASELLRIAAQTGSIALSPTESMGAVELQTATGEVSAAGVDCRSLSVKSSTGTVFLHDVTVAGSLSVQTNTGDIQLENSDAGQITFKTNTGDVRGTLLSEKIFVASTSTGSIRVPQTAAGGLCEIATKTGNVDIELP